MKLDRIGLGGGCHWCTEAVYQVINGVAKVEQGWIASTGKSNTLSEAIIVHFDSAQVTLSTLIEIHLHTHSSTSQHSMRTKYRSAVYYFTRDQEKESKLILNKLKTSFVNKIITKVQPFESFKPSLENFKNYYSKNQNKPFCKRYIQPKLKLIEKKFGNNITNGEI